LTAAIYLANVWYTRDTHGGRIVTATSTRVSTSAPRGRRAKTPPPEDFSAILRAALKARTTGKTTTPSDCTLYRVSMETGIGQDILSRFVREERGLSLETAGRLAVHLGYQLKRD
jgi:hypothetical protein